MKKSIVLIALVLIMVASVFAAAEDVTKKEAVDTPVEIKLEKESKYQYGIVASSTTAISKVTDTIKNTEDTIRLIREAVSGEGNEGKFRLSTNSSYKIQYLFYEYDAVKLNVTVSGNLNYYDTDNSTVLDQIPFKLHIDSVEDSFLSAGSNAKKQNTKEINIESDSSSLTDTIISYEATDLLGCARFADISFTVGPKGESDYVNEKKMGTYKATITLQAVAK